MVYFIAVTRPAKKYLILPIGIVIKQPQSLFTFPVNLFTFDFDHPDLGGFVPDQDGLALDEEVPEDGCTLELQPPILRKSMLNPLSPSFRLLGKLTEK